MLETKREVPRIGTPTPPIYEVVVPGISIWWGLISNGVILNPASQLLYYDLWLNILDYWLTRRHS